mgnify:FL=1
MLPETLLLKIPTEPSITLNDVYTIRDNATVKRGADKEEAIFCREATLGFISCTTSLGSQLYLLNRNNGRLGYATILGALMDRGGRDTVANFIYNCTKF